MTAHARPAAPCRAPRRGAGASRDSLRCAPVAAGASRDSLRCAPVVSAAAHPCCLAALALAALAHVGAACAEPLFVIEQLVVNVNSAPGGEGERVASIKSGDRVEVLERQGDDARVQLANGTQGWVRSSYLSADPPSQRRLQDAKAEIDKLKQNVARLEAQLAAARLSAPATGTTGSGALPGSGPLPGSGSPGSGAAPGSGLTPVAPPAANPAAGGAAQEAVSPPAAPRTATHNGSLFSDSGDPSPWPVWAWASGCSVIALALGFLLGWRALDRRIRQKYGGLKIY